MTSYRFTGPTRIVSRKGNCPTCGKRVTRTRTFQHTVNPWNRHQDGRQKTWADVARDVSAEANAWQPDPEVFEHAKCAMRAKADGETESEA